MTSPPRSPPIPRTLHVWRTSRRLEGSGETEVRSADIGQLIMDALASLDQVAYVRFASVYRNFREAGDFEAILDTLRGPEDEEPAWRTDD